MAYSDRLSIDRSSDGTIGEAELSQLVKALDKSSFWDEASWTSTHAYYVYVYAKVTRRGTGVCASEPMLHH